MAAEEPFPVIDGTLSPMFALLRVTDAPDSAKAEADGVRRWALLVEDRVTATRHEVGVWELPASLLPATAERVKLLADAAAASSQHLLRIDDTYAVDAVDAEGAPRAYGVTVCEAPVQSLGGILRDGRALPPAVFGRMVTAAAEALHSVDLSAIGGHGAVDAFSVVQTADGRWKLGRFGVLRPPARDSEARSMRSALLAAAVLNGAPEQCVSLVAAAFPDNVGVAPAATVRAKREPFAVLSPNTSTPAKSGTFACDGSSASSMPELLSPSLQVSPASACSPDPTHARFTVAVSDIREALCAAQSALDREADLSQLTPPLSSAAKTVAPPRSAVDVPAPSVPLDASPLRRPRRIELPQVTLRACDCAALTSHRERLQPDVATLSASPSRSAAPSEEPRGRPASPAPLEPSPDPVAPAETALRCTACQRALNSAPPVQRVDASNGTCCAVM
jgi:hypothetical protein